jgi:sugar phosphate isomerase/epimerase
MALEPGVMFWAGRDDFARVRALGVRFGQLGVSDGVNLTPEEWKAAFQSAGFTLVTVFAAFEGESYADIVAVRATVGFVPPATRAARERRFLEVSDFAAELGAPAIACHIGCVQEEDATMRDLVRRVCDHAAAHGQMFALETGQERPEALANFIRAVDRPNLRVNFDPANMILYGSGDPVEGLRLLAPWVISVHMKDGDSRLHPRVLGKERPLGQGAVGVERFIAALREIGFQGPLNIERETEDQAERWRDIAEAVRLLERY